jgi:HD superfamily phosphohydrolase
MATQRQLTNIENIENIENLDINDIHDTKKSISKSNNIKKNNLQLSNLNDKLKNLSLNNSQLKLVEFYITSFRENLKYYKKNSSKELVRYNYNHEIKMNYTNIEFKYKQLHDPIYGPIWVSKLATVSGDHPMHKRLDEIRQLGTLYTVFSSATHTRRVHSWGTYHKTKEILINLRQNSDYKILNSILSKIPELQEYYKTTYGDIPDVYKCNFLDDFVIELVAIAGLHHDDGHACFSHLFDTIVEKVVERVEKEVTDDKINLENKDKENLENKDKETNYNKKLKENLQEIKSNEEHEARSCLILDTIILSNDYLKSIITKDLRTFMKNCINPNKDIHLDFIYQILSNTLNSIDTDKMDYIERDNYNLGLANSFSSQRIINDAKVLLYNNLNVICYPLQVRYGLADLFINRWKMHREAYNHPKNKGIEDMIKNIIILLDPILELTLSLTNIEKFCRLTDSYIFESLKMLKHDRLKFNIVLSEDYVNRINEAYNIYEEIQYRQLYKYIGEINSEQAYNSLKLELNLVTNLVDVNKVYLTKTTMGYISGRKSNPLESFYFYDSKNTQTSIKLDKERISPFASEKFQEFVGMLFVKDKTDVNTISRVRDIYKRLIS